MRDTLENLRQRPKEEKTAIAASIAIGVMALLLVGWLIFFLHSLATTPAPDVTNVAASLDTSGLQQAGQQFQQAYGSTTQFIESASGTVELEQVGTSSIPSL